MVKNWKYLENLDKKFILKNKLNYEKSLKIFEAMWNHGVEMAVLPPKNLLDGIEVDIQVAKVLNSCLKN